MAGEIRPRDAVLNAAKSARSHPLKRRRKREKTSACMSCMRFFFERWLPASASARGRTFFLTTSVIGCCRNRAMRLCKKEWYGREDVDPKKRAGRGGDGGDLPPIYGPGAMLVNSEFRQRSGPRFEGRAAARRGSNAA